MKLERYILNSIFNYPSLYSRNNLNDSRHLVLNQLFLTIGNGIEYKNPKNEIGKGYFDAMYNERKYKLSNKDCKRLSNGEKIVKVNNKVCPKMLKAGIVWSQYSYENEEKILFYSDFLNTIGNKRYLHKGHFISSGLDPSKIDYVIEVFPPEKDEYLFYAYPFSIEYTPFWDRANKRLIDRNLIADDWRNGIVEIYTLTQKWFEDDDKFLNNHYFNWIDSVSNVNQFIKDNWDKQSDKLKLCKEYEIPPKEYSNPKEMIVDIIQTRRLNSISECQQIINHYQ